MCCVILPDLVILDCINFEFRVVAWWYVVEALIRRSQPFTAIVHRHLPLYSYVVGRVCCNSTFVIIIMYDLLCICISIISYELT